MKYRLALPVAAAALSLLASSCTPWVEPGDQTPQLPQPPNGDVAARRNAPGNLDETERPAPRRHKTEVPPDETDSTGSHTAGPSEPQNKGEDQGSGGDTPTPAPKKHLPMGVKVPGKPGIVLSPYTNKRVDVSGIPSGKAAEDPTFGGKHFIVP